MKKQVFAAPERWVNYPPKDVRVNSAAELTGLCYGERQGKKSW